MLKPVKHGEKGFGLIAILAVLILVMILYSMRGSIFGKSGKSISPIEHIEQQLRTKTQAENQVRNIQKTLQKRYQNY